MSEKRKHASAFQVGPSNLPDGTRKRKADRIKQALIDRAKIKQDFAKVKKRKLEQEDGDDLLNVYERVALEEHHAPAIPPSPPADIPPEPVINSDRQALMDGPELPVQAPQDNHPNLRERKKFKSKVKTNPYKKQTSFAQKQKEEADQRQAEREENHKQWEQKTRDREKFQAMVRKAKRPTVDGKRKLGRESGFLLEKVRKMVEG